jgi:tetraacyldisaccharide 4'-kinase
VAGLIIGTSRIGGLEQYWYSKNVLAAALLPLSWLFRSVVEVRRRWYGRRNRAQPRLPVPVIVVGNISVGGTGKTPLVIWLTQRLQTHGYRPGVISRGYGGAATEWPKLVDGESDPNLVGDEPVVIARRTHCPVAVAPRRNDAARVLLNHYCCDTLISDDGLQHYGLIRDVEVAVIDGETGLGNGWCLPAGPLREPTSRLREIDFVVTHGALNRPAYYAMTLHGDMAINVCDPGVRRSLLSFAGDRTHAVAGIGKPARFFSMLESCGLDIETHNFPDHHRFAARDIEFCDKRPVLMTEKDAVKCRAFAQLHHWYVPVTAVVDERLSRELIALLRTRAPRAFDINEQWSLGQRG